MKPAEDLVELPGGPDRLKTLKEVEGEHLLRVLKLFRGNLTEVARVLSVSRAGLYRKIDEHLIDLVKIRKPYE